MEDNMNRLYGECIELVIRMKAEKGEDSIKPFAEFWNEELDKIKDITEEWLEVLKDKLTRALEN